MNLSSDCSEVYLYRRLRYAGWYLWFSHTLGFAGFKFCVIGKEMEGMLVDGAWHGVERIDGSLGGWPLVRC